MSIFTVCHLCKFLSFLFPLGYYMYSSLALSWRFPGTNTRQMKSIYKTSYGNEVGVQLDCLRYMWMCGRWLSLNIFEKGSLNRFSGLHKGTIYFSHSAIWITIVQFQLIHSKQSLINNTVVSIVYWSSGSDHFQLGWLSQNMLGKDDVELYQLALPTEISIIS